jgi:DNA mismatch endonuclease (patch repair protein)
MADTISRERRSYNMSRIRGKDTEPELVLRKFVFSLGHRYRLHGKNLPGKPDIIFPSKKKAIFMHGCFWHQHENCSVSHQPKSNLDYWMPKLKRTIERDKEHIKALKKLGWKTLVIWECEVETLQKMEGRILRFLGPSKNT